MYHPQLREIATARYRQTVANLIASYRADLRDAYSRFPGEFSNPVLKDLMTMGWVSFLYAVRHASLVHQQELAAAEFVGNVMEYNGIDPATNCHSD